MGYLNQAATELTAAMELEKEGEFSSAIRRYRTAVDTLITGVKGECGGLRKMSWWGREKEGQHKVFTSIKDTHANETQKM